MTVPRLVRGDIVVDTRKQAPPLLYVGYTPTQLHFVTLTGRNIWDKRENEQYWQIMGHVDMGPFEKACYYAANAAKEKKCQK